MRNRWKEYFDELSLKIKGKQSYLERGGEGTEEREQKLTPLIRKKT